jgi:pentatricopeptide repeat protein
MDSKGVKPNNVIYGMMIYGYGREGSSYKSLKLIMEMRKSGLVPNIASYGLTIRLLCNEGKWQEAEAMVDDMLRAGLRTSESICRALLDAKARLDGSADDSFT